MTTTYSTDWDIEAYYDATESEEHWKLRKAFMEVHKDKFPENYLVALAKAFTNIEFMGCRYPEPLMQRIASLSRDVAKTYREIKKTKLQRTFVSAKNAASSRYSGRKSDPGPVHIK